MRTVGMGVGKKNPKEDDNKLKAENKSLKAEVKALKAENEELKQEIARMEGTEEDGQKK